MENNYNNMNGQQMQQGAGNINTEFQQKIQAGTISANGGLDNYEITTENNISMKVSSYCELITNVDLAKRITSTLKLLFCDYKGTFVDMDGNGQIQVVLWFDPNMRNGEGIKAVERNDLALKGTGSKVAELKNMNTIMSGNARQYVVTNQGKSLLAKFIGGDPNKINWRNHIGYYDEKPQQYATNNRETLVKITGCNIRNILRFIHGSKVEVDNDSKQPEHAVSYDVKFVSFMKPNRMPQYQMNPYGVVVQMNQQQEFLLQILCIDNVLMDELKNTMGINPSLMGSIQMY